MNERIERTLEYVEEMGRVPLQGEEDIKGLITELEELGYTCYISDCTDYLVVE